MAYVTNGEDVATLADLQAITNNSKPPLPERLKSQIWTVRLCDWFEAATLISFLTSMWLVVHAFLTN